MFMIISLCSAFNSSTGNKAKLSLKAVWRLFSNLRPTQLMVILLRDFWFRAMARTRKRCVHCNRDLTHIRRRRRWWRQVKMCFYFTLKFRIYLDPFSVFVGIKTCPCWICYKCVQLQKEIRNNKSRCGSRSSDNAEFGHSRCCFEENDKEMYQEL